MVGSVKLVLVPVGKRITRLVLCPLYIFKKICRHVAGVTQIKEFLPCLSFNLTNFLAHLPPRNCLTVTRLWTRQACDSSFRRMPSRPQVMTFWWFQAKTGRKSGAIRRIHGFDTLTIQS